MSVDQDDEFTVVETSNPGEVPVSQALVSDEQLDELNKESVQTDELISIANAVGKMAESVANAPEGETITEATATALGLAIENLIEAAGEPPRRIFVAEHFASYGARKEARQVALEGMTDVIKAITRKIVKFIRKIMAWLMDTMQELVNGADNLLAAARETQQNARAIAHRSIAEGQDYLDDNRLVHFFSKQGEVYNADAILETYKTYTAEMKDNFAAGFIKEIGLRVDETMEEAKKGESKEATEGKVDKLITSMLGKTFKDFKTDQESDNHEVRDLDLPFDDRRLVLLLSKEDTRFTGFSIEADKAKGEPQRIAERKLETMDFSQINRVAKEIENQMLFGIFKSYKASKGDLQRIRNSIERGCDQVTKAQQSRGTGQSVQFSLGFLKDLADALVKSLVITHRYDIMAARRLLEYCQRSIKAHR